MGSCGTASAVDCCKTFCSGICTYVGGWEGGGLGDLSAIQTAEGEINNIQAAEEKLAPPACKPAVVR